MPVEFSADQKVAFDQICDFIDNGNRDTYTLFGLAGVGKTTVMAEIGHKYRLPMTAFTGKAASVLQSKRGLQASTIHSYIYDVEKYRENGEIRVMFSDKFSPGELFGQVMLVDEVSMLNHSIARDMLRTGMRLIASGDPGQLPPVVGEPYFTVPDFTLTEPHRQALESPIIRQAYRIRNGLHYETDGAGFQVLQTMPRQQLLEADAILVYTNRTRRDLTIMVRDMHGYGRKYPQAGEPVMCLKNCKDYNLFNGAIYTLLKPFGPDDKYITIEVNGDEVEVPYVEFECIPADIPEHLAEPTTRFDFGYVLTCHKAQGSEWDNIVVVDEYPLYRDDRNRWLYTAVTRAAEQVSILPAY